MNVFICEKDEKQDSEELKRRVYRKHEVTLNGDSTTVPLVPRRNHFV